MFRILFALPLLGTALLALGCSSGLPDMEKVTGTVTIDGKAATQGTVQFVPETTEGEEPAPPSVGIIGPDGKYELESTGKRGVVPGAAVGHHQVRVEIRAEPRDQMDTLPRSLIPTKYNNPDTSGLQYEVVAGKDNVIDIELSTNP